MSLPSLIIRGSTNLQYISEIKLGYTAVSRTPLDSRHYRPICLKHDVFRELIDKGANQSTGKRAGAVIPYSEFRFIHTWIGYVDVRTDSVVAHDDMTSEQAYGIELINSAILYYDNNGITSSYSNIDNPNTGTPTIDTTIKKAYAVGSSWTYKIEKVDGAKQSFQTQYWVIKDINVVHNQNSTSRVTFHFEQKTPWQPFAKIIDALPETTGE